MKEVGNSIQTLNNDFTILSEKNRKNVIEMTKFLIITQNTIIPGLLNFDENKFIQEEPLNHQK